MFNREYIFKSSIFHCHLSLAAGGHRPMFPWCCMFSRLYIIYIYIKTEQKDFVDLFKFHFLPRFVGKNIKNGRKLFSPFGGLERNGHCWKTPTDFFLGSSLVQIRTKGDAWWFWFYCFCFWGQPTTYCIPKMMFLDVFFFLFFRLGSARSVLYGGVASWWRWR